MSTAADTAATALKVSDVMTRWQCARKTVLDAIKDGRLSAFKVGKAHWRIPFDEVARFETEHNATDTSTPATAGKEQAQ